MHPAEQDLLVFAAQDGNAAAFERLVRLHDLSLRRFACSVSGDADLAADAVQDAWLLVSRTLRRLEDPRAFRSWVFRAVRWKVLERLRQPHRRDVPLDEADTGSMATTEVGRAEQLERDDALRTGMRQLAAIDRQALHLFYLQELSLIEIAGVLEVPVGTVKSRLSRARRQLKLHLEQHGDTP
jgi:RNA polymerase sigma factor (sigma-70 family)